MPNMGRKRKHFKFPENLKQFREDNGFTQVGLAEELTAFRGAPIYQHQISEWEAGGKMSKATAVVVNDFAEWIYRAS